MPLQIDHVETHIEIAGPSRSSGAGASSSSPQAIASAVAEARAQLAASMGTVLAAELDRFLKTRGLG